MRLEYRILAAVGLDLLLGDPRWLPHPVRGIGWLAARLEGVTRPLIASARLAGVVAALCVLGVAGGLAWAAVIGAGGVHPVAGDVVAVVLIYTAIAARDLARHSMAVYRALAADDLPRARKLVGLIVGRDTAALDEPGVVRAAVESVAESTVDGVTAPLFFAAVAGPVGAIAYRAANTLDSMFGYKDERYIAFGWASARLDDAANWLPARLTAPLVCLAAALARQRPVAALRTLVRDGRKHESPNAGLCEAAMAGALGVQLGGPSYYSGELVDKPTIGDPVRPLTMADIPRANALMFLTTALFVGLIIGLRLLALTAWRNMA